MPLSYFVNHLIMRASIKILARFPYLDTDNGFDTGSAALCLLILASILLTALCNSCINYLITENKTDANRKSLVSFSE